MKISSKLHTQPGTAQHLVLRVRADGKPFFAAIMVGDMRSDPPTLSPAGQECLRLLTVAQDATSNRNQVHLVEVAAPERAGSRLIDVAMRVARHDAVAFVCRDDETSAAMLRAIKLSR